MRSLGSCCVSYSELNQLPLMSHLAIPQLNKIQKTLKQVRLTVGERLFEQGQPADKFYMVRSGQIKLCRVSQEGSERVVDIKQPGQIFAETVLLQDKCVYPLNAEALNNAELLAFDFVTFRNILDESKETCFQFMTDMSRGLQQHLDQVDYLTFQNANSRLINYLLQQIPACVPDNRHVIKLSASKSVIASWLSIQPETLSRILRNLKTRELIQVNGNSIVLLDIVRLKGLLACEQNKWIN